ncbi:MAG: ribosome hibernation-promoting factor, HPF/YfiA family [Bacteriovoracia bacterium]
MNITITFKHLEHTPALDERIREKSEKLNKYFGGQFKVHWVCWVDEHNEHWAEVKVTGQSECYAKAHSENLYKAFDLVIEKIERQLEKQKSKLRNRVHSAQSQKQKQVA